jgi:hypothetical protein
MERLYDIRTGQPVQVGVQMRIPFRVAGHIWPAGSWILIDVMQEQPRHVVTDPEMQNLLREYGNLALPAALRDVAFGARRGYQPAELAVPVVHFPDVAPGMKRKRGGQPGSGRPRNRSVTRVG